MSALAVTEIPRRFPAPRVIVGTTPRLTNGAFALVIGAVGVCGLMLSLLINVATTQGAFQEASLTRDVHGIEAAQQAAQQALAMLASPGNLEARARAMGMVPAASPVFLRLADGKVLGKPEAAQAQPEPSSVALLMPTTQALGPELQMAPAAVKARVIPPTSDAAVELPAQQAP
ncbi:MAG: hypothetical protein ACYC3W_00245 [Candidatus Nanopelagicales bacterium]